MPEPRVLVLTAPVDPTADMVLMHLDRLSVPFVRMDGASFPTELSLAAHLRPSGPWQVGLGDARLDDLTAIYYRRPGRFVFDSAVPSEEIGWCEGQARHGFWGVLESLPATWVNHPTRVGWAEYKPRQLAVAAAVGLSVPPTLVTNLPDAVVAFADEHRGDIVTKVLYARMPRDQAGHPAGVAYTTLVPPERAGEDTIGLTAHLFQARVPRRCDVRLTVVGQRMFAAELYPDNGTPPPGLDWRQHHDRVRYRSCQVPDTVAAAVLALMNRLGLSFGALDFVVTPDHEWVFMEINPNGQWAWIERATGLPIAAALAELLAVAG